MLFRTWLKQFHGVQYADVCCCHSLSLSDGVCQTIFHHKNQWEAKFIFVFTPTRFFIEIWRPFLRQIEFSTAFHVFYKWDVSEWIQFHGFESQTPARLKPYAALTERAIFTSKQHSHNIAVIMVVLFLQHLSMLHKRHAYIYGLPWAANSYSTDLKISAFVYLEMGKDDENIWI